MREGSCVGLNSSGFHHLHYTDWGDTDNPRLLLCMHGLTRNGRDFDRLAEHFSDRYRVVCPDFVGRGKSDRLPNPMEYDFPQYLRDAASLLAHLPAREITWLGTSMGGVLGMLVAALPNNPVHRLILNDVGPFIPKTALERIKQSLERPERYPDLNAVEQLLRRVHAPFGPLSDRQWREMAVHSSVQTEQGDYRLHYDPAIATPFREKEMGDVDLWAVWCQIQCPTLVLRGAESDILPEATADRMLESGPRTERVTFAGIGHAPALLEADQWAPIEHWLDEQDAPCR